MAKTTTLTFEVALLFLLDTPYLMAQSTLEDPVIVKEFDGLLQKLGASFLQTTQSLQPPVDSRLRVPSALTQPSIEDAEYYMYFAYASYCSPESMNNFTCDPCLQLGPGIRVTAFIQNNIFNTRAFVAIDDIKKEIIVTFRGTENVPNAVEDLILVPIHVEGPSEVRVHAGFYEATLSIYSEVVAAVQNLTLVNPNYAIKVVGHSLGGCEAVIATYLFKVNSEFSSTNPLSLFTYGQPRVGNRAFADYMNSLSIPFARVTQRADLFVHIFPAFLGYIHTQNELFVNVTAASARYCNTSIYEDPTCSNSYCPLYTPVDHFYYFNVPFYTCILRDPYSFACQLLVPLQQFIPLIEGSTPFSDLPAFLAHYIVNSEIMLDKSCAVLGLSTSHSSNGHFCQV